MTFSRKEFLKLGAGIGALGGISLLTHSNVAKAAGDVSSTPANAKAALYDNTICMGCRYCESACRKANNLPAQDPTKPDDVKRIGLSAYTFTRIRMPEVQAPNGTRKAFVKVQCMHCIHPACAEACIVGALQKQPDGPVTYDENKCIGCRYCQAACPFGIPSFEWDKAVPWIRKCSFCAKRQDAGQQPACVDICPTHALRFDTRENLLALAHQRIQAEPARYVNYVYGEKEVGGTSWLYLSSVPFANLGLAPHISEPVTINAARAMEFVPPVLMGVAAAMTGVYWLTKRRQEAARVSIEKGDEHTDKR